MALDLYMLDLKVQDMGESLEFYRRLGLAIPEGSEGQTHVQIKMGNGLTFFFDARPSSWDPGFVRQTDAGRAAAPDSYPSVLEFYLKTQAAVEAKYAELTSFGCQGLRALLTGCATRRLIKTEGLVERINLCPVREGVMSSARRRD